jgi:hypothetical protein
MADCFSSSHPRFVSSRWLPVAIRIGPLKWSANWNWQPDIYGVPIGIGDTCLPWYPSAPTGIGIEERGNSQCRVPSVLPIPIGSLLYSNSDRQAACCTPIRTAPRLALVAASPLDIAIATVESLSLPHTDVYYTHRNNLTHLFSSLLAWRRLNGGAIVNPPFF